MQCFSSLLGLDHSRQGLSAALTPQLYFLDQATNRPAGQWLGSLLPELFWDQVKPQPCCGNQENLPPSRRRTQMWNLVGVGEDAVLGQSSVTSTRHCTPQPISRHAPPIHCCQLLIGEEQRVTGEVHPAYAFPCSRRGIGRSQ